MTESDLEQIETSTGFNFPADLRELYLTYSYPEDSWADDVAMPGDVGRILEMNGRDSIHDSIDRSRSSVLQIGSDGGESLYLAEVHSGRTRILEFDLETGVLKVRWPNLALWRAHIQEVDEELAADASLYESRASRRPWWKFWAR